MKASYHINNQTRRNNLNRYFYACTLASLFTTHTVYAEIIFDGSIGAPAGTTLSGNMTVNESSGLRQGNNVLFSFQTFNVNSGESVNFNTATAQNIISRITGGQVSTILEDISNSDSPGAALWFINPAGFIFGNNAQVSVSSALHFSTADYIRFTNGIRFEAFDPKAIPPNTFTTANPDAFGFLGIQPPADITLNGAIIVANNNISLVAGNINLTGNTADPTTAHRTNMAAFLSGQPSQQNFDISALTTLNGQLSLAAVQSAGEAVLQNQSLDLSNFSQRGDISITAASYIFVTEAAAQATGTASVLISGNNITLDQAAIFGVTTNGNGGILRIDAANNLNLGNEAAIITQTSGVGPNQAPGIGAGGNIALNATNITMAGNSNVFTTTSNSGGSGNITLNVDNMTMGEAQLLTTALPGSSGGPGAGDVTIVATGNILLQDGTDPQTQPVISSSSTSNIVTNPSGNAGNVSITATQITIDKGTISNTTIGSSAGQGGNLSIITDDLNMRNNATVTTSNSGSSNSGTLSLNINNMNIDSGATVALSNTGSGDGGTMIINAQNDIHISGTDPADNSPSGLFSTTSSTGAGGDITVTTNNFTLNNNAQIKADSTSTGIKGTISITVRNAMHLSDSAILTAGNSSGGDINIQTNKVLTLNDSTINTESGGNITIGNEENPIELVALNKSSLSARSLTSSGGNLRLISRKLVQSNDSDLDADFILIAKTRIGLDPATDEMDLTFKLDTPTYLDITGFIQQRCVANSGLARDTFVLNRLPTPALPQRYRGGQDMAWLGYPIQINLAGDELKNGRLASSFTTAAACYQ